jgi:WD40 repeat protein
MRRLLASGQSLGHCLTWQFFRLTAIWCSFLRLFFLAPLIGLIKNGWMDGDGTAVGMGQVSVDCYLDMLRLVNCRSALTATMCCSILLLMGRATMVEAEPLQLQPPSQLMAAGARLNVSATAVPCVVDWNGDGCKDLVVNYEREGKIRVFLNEGSDIAPVYSRSFDLMAGGKPIQHPVEGVKVPAVWVCDWNHDGGLDLLVGKGVDGVVLVYTNTSFSTNEAPVLAVGQPLLVDGQVLSVGSQACPYLCDFDEDGLPDLLCGAGDGFVYYFRNTGDLKQPEYHSALKLQAGGTNLWVTGGSAVRLCDWDGDGLKDLVLSSNSGVYWCRNTNNNQLPVFEQVLPLRAPVSGLGLANLDTGGPMHLDLSDQNGDGVIDLMVGNADGTIFVYEGYHFRMEKPVYNNGELTLKWKSAPFLNYTVTGGSNPLQLRTVATNLPSTGVYTYCTTCTVCVFPPCFHSVYQVHIQE